MACRDITFRPLGRRARAMGALVALVAGFVTGCAAPAPSEEAVAAATQGRPTNPDELLVVDCLLPGQVRKLGSQMTYLTPRRPIKTTARDCEIRGGEYVAYDRANYKTALRVWLEQARQGDAQAQTYVGEIYEKGLGTAPDYGMARQWYAKAAVQGYARAQLNLGYLYERGLGVEKDVAKALDWYRRASGLQKQGLEFAATLETTQVEDEITRLREAVKEHKQEATFLRSELAETQDELDAQKAKVASTQRHLAELRQQLKARRAAAGSASADDPKVQALEREIVRYETRTRQQREQMAWLESELQQEKAELERKLQAAQQRQRELASKLSAKSQETEALEGELASVRERLTQTQSQLEARSKALERKKAELTDAKRAGIAETDERIARKEADIRRLEEQLAEQREALKRQRRQIAVLAEKAKETEQEKQKAEAVKVAAAAPPTIQIIDPPVVLTRGVPAVKLRSAVDRRKVVGRVTAPAGLLTLRVNDWTQEVKEGGLFEADVPVREPETPVEVVAIDTQGQRASMEFKLVPLRYVKRPEARRQPPPDISDEVEFGRYYALIIGNNEYPRLPDLETAVSDARAIEDILSNKYGFETTLLIDADRYAMLSALNELRKTLTEKDNLLIYYAGHGELDRANERGYWLPVDAEPDSTVNWVSNIQVTDILNAMAAKHVFVAADSCYSGSMTRSSIARLETGMTPEVRRKWLGVMTDTRSRTVLTSGGLKPVLDTGGAGHSVFARAFLQVLKDNDGVLEGYKLYREVFERVRTAAAKYNISQEPEYAPIQHAGHESGEFFFVPKGGTQATGGPAAFSLGRFAEARVAADAP